jgi:DNA invertase Pin-like site-specific DNA recombinase
MRLVAYLRVSSEGQVDGYGLDVQERAVRAWAKAHGHRIVALHTDAGISGATDAADRPGLSAALLALQRPPEAEGLVVARLDRLARALTVQEAALAVAWRAGGRVFTADAGEVLRDDPDDPMRTALRQVVGVFAELDRRMVVKRLRDGRKAKADAGRHSTGAYAYGLRGGGKGRQRDAVPDEDERLIVERVGELRSAGDSYRSICATLTSEGFRPRRAVGWSPMVVRAIALRAGM